MVRSYFLSLFLRTSIALLICGGLSAYTQDNKPAAEPPQTKPKVKSIVIPPATVKPDGAPAKTMTTPSSAASLQITDFDADKSGDVSSDEFLAYHAERVMKFFEAIDADKNGSLSQEEMARIQRRTSNVPGSRPPGSPPAPTATVKVEPTQKGAPSTTAVPSAKVEPGKTEPTVDAGAK